MTLNRKEAEEAFISETINGYLGKDKDYKKFKEACAELTLDEKQQVLDRINKLVNEKRVIADEAVEELLEVIKNFTIWDLGKYNNELEEFSEKIKNNDCFYSSRINLYKRALELPKYKDLDEYNKIRLAMKIGSLDCTDFKGISK